MADVKWIKITTDIFDDEKMLLIDAMPSADSIIVIWFKLLALAGKQNNSGVFMMGKIAYTDEMLAAIFRRDTNTVRMALGVFEQMGMVEIVNEVFTIPNWNKHQSLDAYEKKKQRDRLYMAERRAAQKALVEKSSDSRLTEDDKSLPVVVSEEDKEEEKEKEHSKECKKRTPAKKKYGEFQRVLLTDDEYKRLEGDFGADNLSKAITFLDAYIEEKGYKSKSHNLAIRRWVMDAVQERDSKPKGRKEMVPKWARDTNPSPERIQKSNDWMDGFLAEEKQKEIMERAERLKQIFTK